jgi:hypothetical protein
MAGGDGMAVGWRTPAGGIATGWIVCGVLSAVAGPYAPAAGQPGSTAIPKDDAAIVAWADGWSDYQPGAECLEVWRTPVLALGPATGDPLDIVCLGRGGRITLTVTAPIWDGPGPDFAVFENAVTDTFLELAFVEVSSDGETFARFPAVSLSPMPTEPIANLQAIDPTDVTGFASKYRLGFGTPFDLADLPMTAGVDTGAIRYIRLLDIPGDGATADNQGNPIYDPYPTIESAGVDIEALGVMHARVVCRIAADAGGVRVEWPARANRWYRPQVRVFPEPWEDLGPVVAGDGAVHAVTHPVSAAGAWFRVWEQAGP